MTDVWISACIGLINGLEIISMILILQLLFGIRPLQRGWNYFVLYAGICIYSIGIMQLCKNQDMLQMVLFFGFLIAYSAIRVDQHRIRAGFEGILACLLYVMWGFLTQMLGMILGLDAYNLTLGSEQQSIFELVVDIGILVALVWANQRVSARQISLRLSVGEELLLLGMSLSSPVFCAGLDRIYHQVDGILYSMAWVLFALGVNIAVFAWIIHRKLTRHYKEVSENYKQSFEEEYTYFRSYKDTQPELVRLRHDMKNHMLTIQGFMEREEYDQAKAYFHALTQSSGMSNSWIVTGNEIVDILLNAKKPRMDEQEIRLEVQGNFGRLSQLETSDCSILIANLLDNAIEANLTEQPERYIKFCASEQPGCLMLLVENSMVGNVEYDGDRLVTTKQDRQEVHGIGTVSIRQIIAKYQGECQMKAEGNRFLVQIILPFVAINDRLSQ